VSIEILTPLGALLALGGLVPLLALRAGEGHARGVARTLGLPEGPPPRAAVAAVAAVAVLLGLAATQPVLAMEHGGLVRTDAEVYVVLDTSRSMLASSDPEADNRFERAQAVALRLRSALDDVPVGVASLTATGRGGRRRSPRCRRSPTATTSRARPSGARSSS
jgi:hypothetical protein